MIIAGKQLQTENKDANNLWKWPTSYAREKWIDDKSIEFVPDIMKWMRFSNVGMGGSGNADICKFTDCSITYLSHKSYCAGVFLDLDQIGSYVLSINSSNESTIRFVQYIDMGNGLVKYGDIQNNISLNKGYNVIQFNKLDGFIPMMLLCGISYSTCTFTNIKITDRIL